MNQPYLTTILNWQVLQRMYTHSLDNKFLSQEKTRMWLQANSQYILGLDFTNIIAIVIHFDKHHSYNPH